MNDIESFPGTLYVGHNAFAHMARVALLALGKPIEDGPIYDFASKSEGFYGDMATIENLTADWARAL
tara:strand:+ start:6635 stop:6835 length:201 start_codon:yes stop_codon:yes gene_type:complete